MANNSTNVILFNFGKQQVRTLLIDDQPWFVAADVCASLAISNVSLAVNGRADRETDGLDEDEKGIATVNTPSGAQEMLVVNESGLYALIFKSRKAEAKRFKKWVTQEVLPAIRKTGGYIHGPAMRPALTKEHWVAINQEVGAITSGWALSDDSKNWIYNRMRVVFQVARVQDVPDDQFELVMLMLRDMREAKYSFLSFVMEVRTWFEKEVLGAGLPWTPTIKSKLSRQLQRQVILPPRVDWVALAGQVSPVASQRVSA
ncbi:hypothetical protein D3C77_412110 [compost metagenome]